MSDEPEVSSERAEVERVADPIESDAAVRLSPYAIAAFVVSLVGVAPGQPFSPFIFFFPGIGRAEVAIVLLSAIVPLGTAVLAFWLAGRGETEIVAAQGRVGGIGFSRAARGVALLTMVLLVASVIVGLAFGDVRDEGFGSDEIEFQAPTFDPEMTPPPGGPPQPPVPAQPAEPAAP